MSVFKCTLLLITLTFCAIVKGDFCNNLQERFQYWGTTSCSELPNGFRLYNSNGLGWNGYSFDDDNKEAGQNQPRNVCRWALFGNGGEWELDVLDTSFGTLNGPYRPHFYGNCAMTVGCSSCMNDELWSGIHYTSSISKGNTCGSDDGDTDTSWSAVECHIHEHDPTKAPSTSPTPTAEYVHNADLGTIEFCGSAIFNGENVFVYNSRQTERANYDDWDTFCLVNAKGVAFGGNGNSNQDCNYAMSQIETVTSFSHQSDDYPPNRSHGSNIYMLCTVNTELGFVDDTSCQWHAMNKMNKVINANQFFGFECPPNQIISELRLEGYGARSVLENNPTAILCCELGGYSLVTNTCVDSYSTADGILEAAICQGNSAMAAIYDLSDPTLEQGQWQYQATKAVTCCDIEYDTSYGRNLDLGIDRSQCEVISHSNQVGSFDVSCPEDMVLIAIRDNDLAHGVQEVHEVECCRVHQATAPSKAPTSTPTTDQPSSAPTTSCYHCLIGVHGNNVSDQDDFVGEIEACLSHCCA